MALCLVAMLGFVALAIDVGALYEERAQLQSGADGAALAVAQNCAKDIDCLNASAVLPMAQQVANQNSRDDRSAAKIVEFDKIKRMVRVQTSTIDKSGTGSLALSISPVLGINTATVEAVAKASWGSPQAGTAIFPIAFAQCEFDSDDPFNNPQVLALGGKGSTKCPDSTGTGHNAGLSGGFGWIGDDKNGSCAEKAAVGFTADSSTGTSLPQDCTAAATAAALKNKTILIPVYDSVSSNGINGKYHISGWAAFKVTGYTFTGNKDNSWNPTAVTNACGNNCDGISGYFVEFVSVDPSFTLGPPSSYGLNVVKLSE